MSNKGRKNSRKAGKKVRVAFRRNREKPAREKDWTRQHRERSELADDAHTTENVVAKGELSRKRTVIEQDYDWDTWTGAKGIVVAMRGLIAEVDDGQRIWPCTVRRILRTLHIEERNPVTVGDRVMFTIEAEHEGVLNEGVIEAVAPRHGKLTRVVDRRHHTIVANVDQAIIVASTGIPPLKQHLIDRYIVATHAGEIEPVVCVNKVDCDTEGEVQETLALYSRLGYRTIATSAANGTGVEELKGILQEKCSVFTGQSGVGKSSLLNAIDPQLKLRVGEVSPDTYKGQHITTTAILIKLKFGGYVVDTPGIKSFDLSAVPVAEIEMHFREFGEFIPNCKFANCTHTHEIGCSVKQAVEDEKIDPDRYESYVRMFEERFGQQ